METLSIHFKKLSKISKVPILDYCRKLIKAGHPHGQRLEVLRDCEITQKPYVAVVVPKIGRAAKLTVKEGDNPPTFAKFTEFPEDVRKTYPKSRKPKTAGAFK